MKVDSRFVEVERWWTSVALGTALFLSAPIAADANTAAFPFLDSGAFRENLDCPNGCLGFDFLNATTQGSYGGFLEGSGTPGTPSFKLTPRITERPFATATFDADTLSNGATFVKAEAQSFFIGSGRTYDATAGASVNAAIISDLDVRLSDRFLSDRFGSRRDFLETGGNLDIPLLITFDLYATAVGSGYAYAEAKLFGDGERDLISVQSADGLSEVSKTERATARFRNGVLADLYVRKFAVASTTGSLEGNAIGYADPLVVIDPDSELAAFSDSISVGFLQEPLSGGISSGTAAPTPVPLPASAFFLALGVGCLRLLRKLS